MTRPLDPKSADHTQMFGPRSRALLSNIVMVQGDVDQLLTQAYLYDVDQLLT